jgi:hypothetical protein
MVDLRFKKKFSKLLRQCEYSIVKVEAETEGLQEESQSAFYPLVSTTVSFNFVKDCNC